MDAVTSTTTESALQIARRVVKRQVSYFFNYNDKFEEVKHYTEMLDNARKRVQNEVNDAEMNAEEIEDDVQLWLKQVDEKIKKYESFLHDERHVKTRCSIGFFPNNLQLRYRLGRNATKMVEEIIAEEHFNKMFDKVSYRVQPSIDIALANISYESFESRMKTTEIIMQALEDSTVDMLGVYGVGGVGKTTLVKEVAKKAQEKKLFNVVVMANITRNPDVEKIQGQIAEMLGMRLEEVSEIVRADRIRKRLKKEKENTLIILDDLWDGLDLNRLGIPCSDDDDGSQQNVKDVSDFVYNKMEKDKLSVDHKGCKILLTSRRKEVICNEMDVQERSTFEVGVIDQKEAETLLKKLAGIHGANSVFDGKAIEIAKVCGGMPLALVSIGRVLKNKSPIVWEDVCQQIKRQSFTEGWESIEFSVKLSYDHLKNELLQNILLHCARMGNDALIMDLVKFCIGMGLLRGVQTIREARNKVNVLIEELKESSLLVGSYSIDRFNMHDIVRDVALSISSKEKNALFMKNGILDEWPHKDELERYTAIFLHYCDINDGLPESIYCPRLEVLHIDSKHDSLKISDDFFKDMIELRVLVLTGVNLSCLPSSIKCLAKLRMLHLERCTLGKNLSIIGELKKLRILTLSGSDIETLPLEFGQLDKLQLFDLSNCSKLRVIPPNTISRMNVLEEFFMRDSLITWEAEENIQSENASLSELRHLNRLGNLDIHIQSVAHFPYNFFLDMLDGYKIVIGDFKMLSVGEFKIPDKHEMVKFLALNLEDGIDIHSEKWIKMLFKGVQYLLLGELNDVHDVSYELNVEGFPNLKHLSIVNNFSIQYIIKSIEMAFPKLESMFLNKLENLEKICDNHLSEASFYSLKIIKIKTCGRLENLFPFSTVRLLINLETIEVCDCDSLKEIVFVERQTHTINDDKIEFPQIQILTLQSLPTFSCLYTNDKMSAGIQSLEDQVPNMNEDISSEVRQGAMDACLSLFNEKVLIPKLERLELSSINIQKIWSDQCLESFQNLLTLNVTDCGNLKYLLSLSMAGRLVNLQSLSVNACEMMEDIFRPEETEHNIDVFPKLKTMEIICMERLNTIWHPHIGLHSFPNLDSLIIRECHKLVTIYPSYMVQRCQSLQSLTITNCKLVENIFDFRDIQQTCDRNETNLHNVSLEELPNLVHVWKDETGEIVRYNNLQSISVEGSPNLKYLFPLSVAKDLEKLEYLEVCFCYRMKEIVAWDEGSNENAITFKFPNLKTVSLVFLFELVNFYGGAHTIELPSLMRSGIVNCWKLERLTTEITNSQGKPIVLATEKVIYNLEGLGMSMKEAEWLQKHVSVHRMHKLQQLILTGLKNSEILFWFLHRLPNLKKLFLVRSQTKRIWVPESLLSHEKKIGVVMQLEELELIRMFYLEDIGLEHDQLLQRVERLVIDGCMKLTNLASSSVSFSHLTKLKVMNCRLMRNLMTCSTAKSLVQLTTMKVRFCPMIVEIVAEHKEEKVQEIEFRRLKSLELISLNNLTSFCSSEKCELKFPLLENLVVTKCPQMTQFAKHESAPKLQKVKVEAGEKDKWYWEGDLNDTLQKYFGNQVSFEYSEQMRLIDYPKMDGVGRHGKPFPDNFFGSLKKLEFDASCERDIIIPSHVLPYLRNLEELNVHSSDAVQVIFDIADNEAKTNTIVFRLKILTLKDLLNLKCVWNENPRGMVSFPNLQEVTVDECGHLGALFPSSIAINLKKLKTLFIERCYKLVEIVGKEDGTTKILFEFPCLSYLLLAKLPGLSCFYPGKYHLECPVLEILCVCYCPKLKLFTASELHDTHKEAVIEGEVSNPIQQSLFSVEKVVPNLKLLTLNEENIILLSDAHLPQDLLCKINMLQLFFEDENNERDTLPFDFLHRVPNLEDLQVVKCFGLKEIFHSQKLQVHEGILGGLKKLDLSNLDELESIGLEHPWVKPYSEKLELLDLSRCSRIEKLVCGVTSFINLKQLFVKSCKRMEYLFTFSTAKSLVQLAILDIKDCESLKEIIKKEDEDASHDIIFGHLTTLMLDTLPRLVRFYSGNATLQFSRLQRTKVVECPNMNTFSEGSINVPLFEGIQTSVEDSDDLTFHDDLNTTIETLFHQQVFFECSKHMILVDCLETRRVRHMNPAFSYNFFGSFKKLEFDGACERDIIIPSHVLPYLKSLEELNVHGSDAVQVIFDIDDNEPNTKRIVFPLKKLTLKDLPNLKCVWNVNPREMISFPNLQEVTVHDCGHLGALFPSSIAINLKKLNTLNIMRCDKLVEIVGKEDAMEEGTTEILFEFPCLSQLLLYKLPGLSWFYPGKHHLECPMLEDLDVSYCPMLKLFTSKFPDNHKEAVIEAPISQQPMFLVEKVVPKLNELTLNEENIIFFSNTHLPQDLLCKLNILEMCFEDENNERDTLPFDFFHRVPNLEHLRVRKCFGLKEIFHSQKLQVHEGIHAGLKRLSLFDLEELESIGLEHPWVKPYSEKFEMLYLSHCSRIEKLVCCAVPFINLKQLFVKSCKRMEYLFTFSTAKSLVQLEILDIKDCESLKEIVKKEDEDDSHDIIFGRLRKLSLNSLPRLVRFYSGNATLQFSRLQIASLAQCPNMKTFSQEGATNAPFFHGIKTSMEDSDYLITFHNDLNTTIERLFHQQVFFEYSKHMILVDCLETTRVRHINPAFSYNFFGSFKKLEFDASCERDIIIPSHVLPYLKNLEELNVHSSDVVQVIFDLNENEAKTNTIVFPLKKLTLKDLPNLKCVWNVNPRGMVRFPNLNKVSVRNCGRLGALFPISIARNLKRLETLKIKCCDQLVEIVGIGKDEDGLMEHGTTEILFEFPCLSLLTLLSMPLLSCFYPGKHHLEFPKLEWLDVSHCPMLKLFSSKFPDSQKEAVIEAPISQLQQHMFLVEKVAPILKQLTLNEENIILFSDAHLPQDLLCKLNVLGLCFEDESNERDTLPFDFLHRVPNIKHLKVSKCFGLKEIFHSQKLQVHEGILAGLKELVLLNLEELKSIGLEHPWVKPYSEKLQKLSLKSCSRLEKLVRGVASFINLRELDVSCCKSMEYLFTFSTAKTLVQLEILDIKDCESIKEMVKKEDEDDSHDIIFGRLRKLSLNSLPRLVRFYSGKATLQFSRLQIASLAQCPNMKTFSQEGVINAPLFEGIQTSVEDSDDLTFHNDLNTTIEMLFDQQVDKSACDLLDLKFGDHPHLEEIWLGVVPIPSDNSFNNLKSLIVVECESLSHVVPFYLLRFLCNLKEIEIRNCQSVEAIFDLKDTGAAMKPASQLSLPLKKLIISQLPNLEHIWNLNPDEILSLQDLQEVHIHSCQSLKCLFPASVANHLVTLEVRHCARLVEIFVEDEAALKGETKQFSFHCLTSLTLWELPELKIFYNGKHSLEWPMLICLDIYHCDKLELFITKHRSGEVADVKDKLGISIDQQAVFSVEKVFPNLVQLSLKKEDAMAISQEQLQVMPSLEHQEITKEDNMLGQGQFGANSAHLLQNLEVLKLMCYHEDDESSNIFSSGFLEKLPKIENLEVGCSSFNEIFSSQRPSTDCTKILSKLKKLHLNNLQHLNSIGLEHSWVEPLLKTLETLEVFSCPCLKFLVPSTVSFSNLITLNVGECHGLVYLFTSSTAKSLGQLKHISIQNCKAIQEIVSKEGDQESNDEEIIFAQLSVLSLEYLPSIVGIYSGTSKFKFPSLDQVTLTECPQLKYAYVPDLHEFKPHEQI